MQLCRYPLDAGGQIEHLRFAGALSSLSLMCSGSFNVMLDCIALASIALTISLPPMSSQARSALPYMLDSAYAGDSR